MEDVESSSFHQIKHDSNFGMRVDSNELFSALKMQVKMVFESYYEDRTLKVGVCGSLSSQTSIRSRFKIWSRSQFEFIVSRPKNVCENGSFDDEPLRKI